MKDGVNDCYIVDIDGFNGKDYLSTLKNSEYYSCLYSDYKYIIKVSDPSHRLYFPTVGELFVNDGSMTVKGYKIGGTTYTNLDLTFAEILTLVDSDDKVIITPVFESTGFVSNPWIADVGIYGHLTVSYGCSTADQVTGILFRYDDQTGYTILQTLNGSYSGFDAEYFPVGTYKFEFVVLLDDNVNLDDITSYEDLTGYKRVKVQQITEVEIGSLTLDEFTSAYLVTTFTYDTFAHKPYWKENASKVFRSATAIVCEEQIDAGDYKFTLVSTNENYVLCYRNGEVALNGIELSWQLYGFSIWVGTKHLFYNGQEQSITIEDLFYYEGVIPGWETARQTQMLFCDDENARVEGNVLYFTNAGHYTISLRPTRNYGFTEQEYVGLIVEKASIVRPTSGKEVEWKPTGDLVSLSDFFANDVSGIVKISDDSILRPDQIGSQTIYFELVDPDNYLWGSSGSGGSGGNYFPINSRSGEERVSAQWNLVKKRITNLQINFYTSQTEFQTYTVDNGYFFLPVSVFENENFEYRIELANSDLSNYCTVEHLSHGEIPPYEQQVEIRLTNNEFVCWYLGGWEIYSDTVTVQWLVKRHTYEVNLRFEYSLNQNNQVEWQVVFENPEYQDLEYDIIFINWSANGPMGSFDGGITEYVNEFPPLIEGVNQIEWRLQFHDPHYVPLFDTGNIEITYSAQTGNNGNDQGGNEDQGGDNSQGGNDTPKDEGCSGSVNSPVVMILSVVMAGAFITIKSRKNKKA